MSCPMTVGACEEYKINPGQQKAFCARGCSVICEEEFRRLCEKQKENFGKEEEHDYTGQIRKNRDSLIESTFKEGENE